MSSDYLKGSPETSYTAMQQNEYRLSPGDGLAGLPSSPTWL